jgi:hypothetical protein
MMQGRHAMPWPSPHRTHLQFVVLELPLRACLGVGVLQGLERCVAVAGLGEPRGDVGEALLGGGELLQLGEDRRLGRPRAARQRPRGLVHVPVHCHRPRPDRLVERHLLCRLRGRTHNGAAKDVLHGALDVLGIADEGQGEVRVALPNLLLRARERLGGDLLGRDLVERDDCDALLEPPTLQQLGARVLGVDDDVVELAAGRDLERRRVLGVVDADQPRDKPVDLAPVEPRVRVRVVEAQACQPRLHLVDNVLLPTRLCLQPLDTSRRRHSGRLVVAHVRDPRLKRGHLRGACSPLSIDRRMRLLRIGSKRLLLLVLGCRQVTGDGCSWDERGAGRALHRHRRDLYTTV